MSAAEAAPDPKTSHAGRLLALVRALIDYGKQLAATFRDKPPSLGPVDIALILARITAGLRRAEALEARISRTAAHLDAAATPRPAHSPRTSPPAQTATARGADSPVVIPGLDPALNLPTAEEIAAEVRRRPIGAVLADICRDLGIMPRHPLWHELRVLIIRYGGNLARLVQDILHRPFQRVAATLYSAWPSALLQTPVHSGVDPP